MFSSCTVGITFSVSSVNVDEGSGFDVQLVSQESVNFDLTVTLVFRDGTAGECVLCM